MLSSVRWAKTMPVEDHPTHERTRIGSDFRYGCHNKPRPVACQKVVSKISPSLWSYVFSTECRYDMSLTDAACEGCQWRGSGERYDQMVRESAQPVR